MEGRWGRGEEMEGKGRKKMKMKKMKMYSDLGAGSLTKVKAVSLHHLHAPLL